MVDSRVKVLRLLIDKGADFNKFYKDPRGREHSCALLALHSSTMNGSNHPLNILVRAGIKLEKDFLASFEQLVENDHHDSGQDKNAHREFIEALVNNLEQNKEEDDVRSALLDITLHLKPFSGLDCTGRNRKGLSQLPLEELQQRFLRAIRYDQTETMEFLLRSSHLKLSFTYGQWERTPLHKAVAWEAVNAVKLLLSLGASVDTTDNEGSTPLHVAVFTNKRNDACISILLDHGASFVAADQYGRTAWHVAAKLDDTTALTVFLKRDKDKDKSLATPEEEGLVPLFYAAEHGSLGKSLLSLMIF